MTDEPSQERLDELQAEIDEIRRRAEEDGTIDDPAGRHERTFIDPDADGQVDGDESNAPG
jgi:hypothetical protein